jgi:peptidoglycan/LPS O-acetylase OafA/YrhL
MSLEPNTLIAKLTLGFVHDGAWGLSVDFFFILSGFVLCQSFLRQTPSFVQYVTKRFFRLYPLFIVTTLIALTLIRGANWSGAELVTNLLAVQSLLTYKSINFPAWSIPFELVLPAFLVPFALLISRRPILALVALLISLVLSTYSAWRLAGGDELRWLRAVGGLAAGCALFVVWRGSRADPSRRSAALGLIFFGLAIVVMALSGTSRVLSLCFPILSALAIWFGAENTGLFSTAPFQALGGWSYSIYLLHIPVLLAAERMFGIDRVASSIPLKLVIIFTCLFAAALSYRFVEMPFINLGRKLTPRADAA